VAIQVSLGIVTSRRPPMPTEHYVEERNLSVAWARALRLTTARGRAETGPLIIAVTGFDDAGLFEEESHIRAGLEELLANSGKQGIDTVANTIFPVSLWNPNRARELLFERYRRVASRLRRASRKNQRGIYFERMMTGGPKGRENQLEFAIKTYLARPGVRRSVLQVGVFDPTRDHSAAAQLGFPCLQHVTFAPINGGLCVNAFYATQYMVERAYGNYVGLCRLGRFVAHEIGLPLLRLTCFTGIAECEMPKGKLAPLLATIEAVVGPRVEGGG
jgi:hypothetical protein